jgi:hypothetical protein
LQPLADGIANRAAGDPIHHLAVIVDSACHHRICFGLYVRCVTKSQLGELFRPADTLRARLVKAE